MAPAILEPMNLHDTLTQLQRIDSLSPRNGQLELSIVTNATGTVAGKPVTSVWQIQPGFDWNKNQLLIYPKDQLTKLTREDVKAIHDSVKEGQSWHAYQGIKKLHERIRTLEAELATLKSGSAA